MILKMKKIFVLVLAAIMASFAGRAQENIRYNYSSKGITHISAEYEKISVQDAEPLWVRVESVKFQDGSPAWLLYINIESKDSKIVPKGVKMAINFAGGKMIRVDQIGKDFSTKRAIVRGKERVYWNRTKYLLEEKEMEKCLGGVTSLDIITGWEPEDFVQVSFPGNELSALLKRQTGAVKKASSKTLPLSGAIARYADSNNSLTVVSKPSTVRGKNMAYNVTLSYLFYKNSFKEDFDLSFQLGTEEQIAVPFESDVAFLLSDGSQTVLRQVRQEDNKIFVYPDVSAIRRMIDKGVKTLVYHTEDGRTVTDEFPDNALSKALAIQYQDLMNVSPL